MIVRNIYAHTTNKRKYTAHSSVLSHVVENDFPSNSQYGDRFFSCERTRKEKSPFIGIFNTLVYTQYNSVKRQRLFFL